MTEIARGLHLLAIIAWLSGMLVIPHLLARSPRPDADTARALRFWSLRVTTPAMLASLTLGLWLAQRAGWFAAAWLQVKLLPVLALTALHGMLSGELRRLDQDPAYATPGWFGLLPWAVAALACVIVLLAATKPHLW